jgi:hypothetical protein
MLKNDAFTAAKQPMRAAMDDTVSRRFVGLFSAKDWAGTHFSFTPAAFGSTSRTFITIAGALRFTTCLSTTPGASAFVNETSLPNPDEARMKAARSAATHTQTRLRTPHKPRNRPAEAKFAGGSSLLDMRFWLTG